MPRAHPSLVALLDRLTSARVARLGWLTAALAAVVLVADAVVRTLAPNGPAVLPDFLAYWTAGRLVGDPTRLYDPAAQLEEQLRVSARQGELSLFVGPPYLAVVFAPLAALPYPIAAALWTALGLAGVLVGIRVARSDWAPRLAPGAVTAGVLASYPVFEAVGSGQTSGVSLAAWAGGLHLLRTRSHGWAGVVLAVGLIKPQHVVLVPVLLVALRAWRALATFGAVGIAAAVLALVVGGPAVLSRWLGLVSSPLYQEQVQVGQTWKLASLPALVQALVAPLSTRASGVASWLTVGLLISVFLIVLLRRTGAMSATLPWLALATLTTTVVASPHLAAYDLVLMVPVAVAAVARGAAQDRFAVLVLVLLGWLAPLLELAHRATGWGWLALPWVTIPVTVLWWRLMREPPQPIPTSDVGWPGAGQEPGRPSST